MIKLTKEQENVAKQIAKHINKKGYGVLSGIGGSGKTTTAKILIKDYLNINEENVLALAPTAAAAVRLKNGGGFENTQTVHSALYYFKRAIDKKTNSFYFIKHKKDIEEFKEYKLILVDEASMLDKNLFDDIMNLNIPVLFMGDNAQLPPVKKQYLNKEEKILFNVMDATTAELTTSLRQKEDNDILNVCKQLRKQQPIKKKNSKDVLYLSSTKLTKDILKKADQVICSKNKWKDAINQALKKEQGFTARTYPIEGDKIVFTKNIYDVKSDKGNSVINGLQGIVKELGKPIRKSQGNKTLIVIPMTIDTDLGVFENIYVDIRPFIEDGKESNIIEVTKDGEKFIMYEKRCSLDFAYAQTTWKSQGSEYNKVVYIQSEFPYIRSESYQEAYTACSRARNKLIICPYLGKGMFI